MNDDLQALVANCLAGQSNAVTKFVRRFDRLVYALCARMLQDPHEAEDMTQETFLRALRSLDRWDPTRPIRPWILTIAGNLCRSALRKRKRRPNPTESMPELISVTSENRDMAEEIERGLAKLPENWRMAFILFYQNELTCQETAEVLGCAEGTIKTWLYRARKKMAEDLSQRGLAPNQTREPEDSSRLPYEEDLAGVNHE